MNVTISIDDALLEKARKLAEERGTSLQELLRDYLRSLVGDAPGHEVADELLELMRTRGGRSGGRGFVRDDAYEGRV
jgi:hypothetical protein